MQTRSLRVVISPTGRTGRAAKREGHSHAGGRTRTQRHRIPVGTCTLQSTHHSCPDWSTRNSWRGRHCLWWLRRCRCAPSQSSSTQCLVGSRHVASSRHPTIQRRTGIPHSRDSAHGPNKVYHRASRTLGRRGKSSRRSPRQSGAWTSARCRTRWSDICRERERGR